MLISTSARNSILFCVWFLFHVNKLIKILDMFTFKIARARACVCEYVVLNVAIKNIVDVFVQIQFKVFQKVTANKGKVRGGESKY